MFKSFESSDNFPKACVLFMTYDVERVTLSTFHGSYHTTVCLRVIFSIFSSNSEASASELLGNIEEMLPQYYIDSDSNSKSSATH